MTETQTQTETIASAPTIAICPHACAWGDIEIIPAKDFLKYFNKKIAGRDTSYCEVYQNGAVVKPFFDFEKEYLQQPSDTEINTQYTLCIDNILDLFDGLNVNKEDIAVAQRHRWALGKETDKKDKNIFKVSFHLFVQGISMKHTDIKYIIDFKNQGDFWDTSVYSNRRMFYMIETVKLGEQGVMKPMTHANNPLAFVGQYIEGTEQMELDKEKYNAVINDDVPVLAEPEDETIQKLQKILREQLGDKNSRHDRGFRFSTNKNKGRVCPCSGETHYSNGFYLQPCENGDVMYVCQAKHDGTVNTKTKIVGNLNIPKGECILEDSDDDDDKQEQPKGKSELNAYIKTLDKDIQSLFFDDYDTTIVNIFLEKNKNKYLSYEDDIIYFNGIRWELITKPTLYKRLVDYVEPVIRRGENVMRHLKTLYDKKQLKYIISTFLNNTKRIRNNMPCKSVVQRLIVMIEFPLYEKLVDNDPYLLGANNGVINLKTGKLEKALPEMYVVKTVGYDYFDEDNPFDEEEYKAFLESKRMVYPIEEEREYEQIYSGYSLLGVHPEKILCFRSDERGGNNGKSGEIKQKNESLGEYATTGDNNFLYKTTREVGQEGHSGNTYSYKGLRWVSFEELDTSRKLDEAKIKKITGGNFTITGRQCGTGKMFSFPFTAKMDMSFNEYKSPNFDYTDKAFLNRLLCIPYRAKFCNTDEDYEYYKHEPYTYEADVLFDEKIKKWRPYYLHYCIEGLMKYYQGALRTIPTTLKDFKGTIVQSKDTIQEFLDAGYENTGDTNDYVNVNELAKHFSNCQNKKIKNDTTFIKISSPDFKKFVAIKLGKENHIEKLQKKQGDKVLCRRNVFTGWKSKGISGMYAMTDDF